MEIITEEFISHHADKDLHHFIARPAKGDVCSTMIIAHAFEGRNELMCQHARTVAEQGYVAIAIDMYGDAVVEDSIEACFAQIKPFLDDRQLVRDRVVSIYRVLSTLPYVDMNQCVAIGFCFGGMCVLELARAGESVNGVVSVHGVLPAAEGLSSDIKSKVLALHGYLDPQVPPAVLPGFAEEMAQCNVDWQMHYFGEAKHAFTDPDAASIGPTEMGREYNARDNDRSWRLIMDFAAECWA